MKAILFCDDTNIEKISALSKKYECGIEVQSFYMQSFLENNPYGLEIHKNHIEGIKHKSLHGPFRDLCPGTADEMIREATRSRFEYAYDKAVKLGINNIVLHHGYVPKTSAYSGWLKRTVEFWQDFLEGKSDNINFHIENQLELDPMLLSDVIKGVGRSNVDVCLDIGHAHCNSKTPVLEWIKYMNKQIGYVHMHDNHGEQDEHLGFGSGNLPLVEACEALEIYSPDAIWAIEAGSDDIEASFLWLKERGFIK